MTEEPRGPLLFAYGTLGPRVGETGWAADAVRGRMFDLGPHPILVGWDEPKAGWVEGHVRETSEDELAGDLDDYEGVIDGLFRRLVLPTREGRRAWVYVYLGDVPQYARGPIARWAGPMRSSTTGPH